MSEDRLAIYTNLAFLLLIADLVIANPGADIVTVDDMITKITQAPTEQARRKPPCAYRRRIVLRKWRYTASTTDTGHGMRGYTTK